MAETASMIPAPTGPSNPALAIEGLETHPVASAAPPGQSQFDVGGLPSRPAEAAALAAAKPAVVRDRTTGKDLVLDHDGGVFLEDVGGTLHKFSPQEASDVLHAPESGFSVPTPERVTEAGAKARWQLATAGEKIDAAGRTILTNIADGVAPVVRGAAALAYGAAGKVSPIEEHLSGAQLVAKLDYGIAKLNNALGISSESPEAQVAREEANQRAMAEGAPVLSTALSVGGLVLGGELGAAGKVGAAAETGAKALGLSEDAAAKVSKLAGAAAAPEKVAESGAKAIAEGLGVSGAAAERLGKYAEQVVQGVGYGVTGATQEAWLHDQPLTVESQLHGAFLGALLGGGTAAVGHGLSAASDAAERVFGRVRGVGSELGTATNDAAEQLLGDVTGVKPAPGTGGVLRGYLEWMRDKIEGIQAERTGAKLEDIRRYGPLNLSEEAQRARALWEKAPEIKEAAAKDLTNALRELHEAAKPITEEVTNMSLKREHVARLLEGSDHAQIMQAGRDKLAELQAGYDALGQVSGRGAAANDARLGAGRSLLGTGKAIANVKLAYEDAIDALSAASSPEDVVMALDSFKRSTQRAKVASERTAARVADDLGQQQARARAELMAKVSDKARAMLEDTSLFGKFGEAQREVNSRWNQMLKSNEYVQPHITERVGSESGAENFGRAKYDIDPRKVASYVDGVGTTRSQTLDGLLRDNIAARKDLLETLVKHYDLGEHAGSLATASSAAKRAQDILKHIDETVAATNAIDSFAAHSAAASGHGMGGAALAAMAGHALAGPVGGAVAGVAKVLNHVLSDPLALVKQTIALQRSAQKLSSLVDRATASSLRSEAGAAAVTLVRGSSGGSKEAVERRYARVVAKLNEVASDPERLADAVGTATAHVTHRPTAAALASKHVQAAGFLASKVPTPLYQDATATKGQLSNVSDSQRDKFLRYVDAVDKPASFFDALANGSATPEQAEVASTFMPTAFAQAQQQAIQAFATGKVTAPYQQRLRVQRLLGVSIEPTAGSGLRQFLTQAAQQDQQQKPAPPPARSSGKSTVAESIKSPLSNLRI